ncbi:phage tail fiber [Escherichia coli]|nr:phage tail fiber [Escherichia coli]
MYHVDNSTGVPVMPQPSPVTSETALFFTEGGNGVPPTYPGPDWFNTIQSELLNILSDAGLDPDKMDNTQILAALKKLFLSRSNPFGDIKKDGAVAIATALSNLGLGGIATSEDIKKGTTSKLVDAEGLIGAIATDADIQNKVARKFVDAYGLINAITTMQDVQDGALRKFVNALTLKNYLPVKALSANGFIRIPDVPGGTIIQYGQVSKSISEGIQNVTLPTPFPNLCRFAIAIPLNQNSDTTVDLFAQLQSLSQTGINFFFSWASSSSPATGFQWFALGY